MVVLKFSSSFQKRLSKIKDLGLRKRIILKLKKIKNNPFIGKPMRYARKGSREVYVAPYRLAYFYDVDLGVVFITDFYHKDKQ